MFPVLYFILTILISYSLSQNEDINEKDSVIAITRWSLAAYEWIINLNCSDQSYFTEETCLLAKENNQTNYRVYGSELVPGQKYGVVFPESESKYKHFHDGVLVLDPFPETSFGHPIAAFYVDINFNTSKCDSMKGFFIEGNACLQPISRNYFNMNMRNYRPKMRSAICPNCGEVIFLPLVYLQNEHPIQNNDRLHCFSTIPGFNKACPQLRPKSETDRIPCDPILTNRNCRFFETHLQHQCSTVMACDQAILISGGWNRQFSDISTLNNVRNIRRLLLLHGYVEENIVTYYANGPEEAQNSEEVTSPYRSASMKSRIRNQIRTLCDIDQCTDTLFIYMNSPTRPDGASLLWDSFNNGVYDDAEIYTAKELMRDVAYCKSNRVVIMADQNYGEALVAAAEAKLLALENVIIFTANEYFNWNTTKDRITKQLMKAENGDLCLQDFKNELYQIYKSPIFLGSNAYLLNSTLIGAPCNIGKTTTLNDPDTFKYRGCILKE